MNDKTKEKAISDLRTMADALESGVGVLHRHALDMYVVGTEVGGRIMTRELDLRVVAVVSGPEKEES